MTFKNPDFASNSPYYDDFEETKNFLKVLFKPGYAVQARELTQLQTILQSQVAKFADHIFQDGSQVFGGQIQIVSTPYARVEKTTYNTAGTSTGNSSDGYIDGLSTNLLKVYSKSGTSFTELATIKISYSEPAGYSAADDYSIVFYNVVSVASSVASGTFTMERDLYIGTSTSGPFLNVINPTLETTNPDQYTVEYSGNAFLVTVNDGIFYIDGYFVTAPKQTISLFKKSVDDEAEQTIDTALLYPAFAQAGVRLFNKPSHRIGYTINRQIVTANDDTTLNDPARGFYNYTAPGADRYKIGLELTSIEYQSGVVDIDNYVTENFIQILRTTKGVVDYIKDQSSYAQILDLFARRTQDESGSYTVKPFIAEVKNHLRKDKYVLTVQANTVSEIFSESVPTIKVGGYIWSNTIPNAANYNPYTSGSLLNESFLIGKVVDIIPEYNENAPIAKTLKLIVELQNAYRFPTGAGGYYYKQSPSVGVRNINVTSINAEIDPKGAYSLLDVPVGNETKMAVSLQPGKAYVHGYEYETFAPRVVEYLNNGNQSDTKLLTGLNVDFEIGNYVKGTFTNRQANTIVNYEEMPVLDLVDIDTNTFLIYPSGTQIVEKTIYAWAPFKFTSEDIQGDIVDILKLTNSENFNASYPHESVIFVSE
jgi:hypothetical protein